MLIGYVRVSKSNGDQVLDPQKDALMEYGVNPEYIYEDYCSGAKDKLEGRDACLKSLREGDTLVIWTLDRLGRDSKTVIKLGDDLRTRNIGLKILAGAGACLDTSTPSGRMMFQMFAVFAEFERNLIIERTKAGLAAARARGRLGGRKRKMTPGMIRMVAAALHDKNTIVVDLAKELKITPQSIYNYVNGDGSLKQAAYSILDNKLKINKEVL